MNFSLGDGIPKILTVISILWTGPCLEQPGHSQRCQDGESAEVQDDSGSFGLRFWLRLCGWFTFWLSINRVWSVFIAWLRFRFWLGLGFWLGLRFWLRLGLWLGLQIVAWWHNWGGEAWRSGNLKQKFHNFFVLHRFCQYFFFNFDLFVYNHIFSILYLTLTSVAKITFPKSTENFLHQTDNHFRSETWKHENDKTVVTRQQ